MCTGLEKYDTGATVTISPDLTEFIYIYITFYLCTQNNIIC